MLMVEITFFIQQKDLDNRPSHGAWKTAYYIKECDIQPDIGKPTSTKEKITACKTGTKGEL